MRQVTAITALMLALLALSGCSTAYPEASYRAQTVGDAAGVEYGEWNIKHASARFLAEEAGIQYFVARSLADTVCLIQIPVAHPDRAVSSCGEHGVAVQGPFGPQVELVVPDMGERPGWRRLAPNLYAEEG